MTCSLCPAASLLSTEETLTTPTGGNARPVGSLGLPRPPHPDRGEEQKEREMGGCSAPRPLSEASGCRGFLATGCAPPWVSKVGLSDPPSGGPAAQAQGPPQSPPKPRWSLARLRCWDSGCGAHKAGSLLLSSILACALLSHIRAPRSHLGTEGPWSSRPWGQSPCPPLGCCLQ